MAASQSSRGHQRETSSFLQDCKISATHKHSTQLQPMMSSVTDPSPISEEDSVQIWGLVHWDTSMVLIKVCWEHPLLIFSVKGAQKAFLLKTLRRYLRRLNTLSSYNDFWHYILIIYVKYAKCHKYACQIYSIYI